MTESRWNDLVMGVLALVWAAVLLTGLPDQDYTPWGLPSDYFAYLDRYVIMPRILPDRLWAALLIIGSAGLLQPPARDGVWLAMRKYAHAELAFIWIVVAVLIFGRDINTYRLLVGSIFVAHSLLHSLAFLRLSQLARLP